jgi:DNA-binding beta-propeller fold protein YncE
MKTLSRGLIGAALALSAVACAAPNRKMSGPIFFPSSQYPRIQYLTSFSGLKDVQEQSSFNKFVVGEQPDLKLDKPYGVGVYDGRIYVCDTNTHVVVFDMKTRRFSDLKGATGQGKLIQPLNISIDSDGTKYVSDPVRGQVVVFNRDDDYVRAYGAPGNWRPVDAVGLGARLYVADPANGVVKVFDKETGEVVKTIGSTGEPSERLDRPTNLAFDGDGYLYVTDVGRFQVVKFDRDGHFKSTFGRPGDNLGHFARPKGIAVDREGRLLAVDASFNNVQMFNKDGRLLMYFGEGGDQPGNLMLPAKVAVDYDNIRYFQQYLDPGFQPQYLILVTSQFGSRFVNVLAYGTMKGVTYPSDADLLQQIEARRKKEQDAQPPATPPQQP